MFRYVLIYSGICFVLFWISLLIFLGFNVFIRYKKGMIKVIYKVIFISSIWGKNIKKFDVNLELR